MQRPTARRNVKCRIFCYSNLYPKLLWITNQRPVENLTILSFDVDIHHHVVIYSHKTSNVIHSGIMQCDKIMNRLMWHSHGYSYMVNSWITSCSSLLNHVLWYLHGSSIKFVTFPCTYNSAHIYSIYVHCLYSYTKIFLSTNISYLQNTCKTILHTWPF
jgi:hypothetical protein